MICHYLKYYIIIRFILQYFYQDNFCKKIRKKLSDILCIRQKQYTSKDHPSIFINAAPDKLSHQRVIRHK